MNRFLLSIFIIFWFSIFSTAQEITTFPCFLSNEYYQDDRKISKSDVKDLLSGHEVSKAYWNKTKLNNRIALGSGLLALGMFYWDISSDSNNGSSLSPQILVMLCATVSTTVFTISADSSKRNAILSYNKINSVDKVSFILGQAQNGLGLTICF